MTVSTITYAIIRVVYSNLLIYFSEIVLLPFTSFFFFLNDPPPPEFYPLPHPAALPILMPEPPAGGDRPGPDPAAPDDNRRDGGEATRSSMHDRPPQATRFTHILHLAQVIRHRD